ncbi:helix-turn-helix domain-containing protein [Acidovorax sp. SUPP2825]|uniref:helix-turn-helix domain-containing protein n=1 Tax=Acidovorax sp. SUPP2825 TaxID=2920879 RepID=UPI0023DE5E75|nr:helix-turn-helix domain-containing protein [Acidovorax sp. SUPP2825]GKS97676.1 helix-turn-helix domain-containing protein [Acidovorax sp. SUPP2825]
MESYRLPKFTAWATRQLPTLIAPLKNRLDLTRLAELDRQFCEFARLQRMATPRCGWTKTIRLAMGMSSQALGARLGMTAQGIRKLEQGEANGTISLNTLAKLAQGLDCEVHYILVPRTTLMEQVLRRTREIAGVDFDLPELSRITELAREPEVLDSLSRLLSKVNKRGLW